MKQDNITHVISLLVAELNIPVTRQSIEEEIARHPSYQSMLAISELLNNWQIPNAAYGLSFEELITTEVSTPFITHLKGSNFVLVHSFDEKQVIASNSKWNKHVLNIDEFKESYNNLILIAEKDEVSGEADYAIKQRKEKLNNVRLPFVITGASVIFLAFIAFSNSYISAFSWSIALLTLFKTAGLVTTILLLVQSIDDNNPLVQKLCGGDSKKNCNAILSSNAAKISEELSWSEAGFFYFTGTWLVLLLNSNNQNIMQMLALLNVISLPYTFYSIYYQWKVAKQWCVFCCTVQALLWLEFFAFLPSLSHGLQMPGVNEWGRLIAGLAVPLLAWAFIKPYLLLSKQMAPLKAQLRKFKYNTNLFQKMLNDGVKYALPAEEDSLIIGNREAEQVITMVSNPYCQPCSKAHKQLDDWLASREDIKLQVVFALSDADKGDAKLKVASHLLSLQAERDDVSLKKALDDWYKQKEQDYDAWVEEHPITTQTSNTAALEIQKEWCKLTEISGTPTIFINGRKLPRLYQTEDIKYFI